MCDYGSFHRVVPRAAAISTGKNTASGISANRKDMNGQRVLQPSMMVVRNSTAI